MTPSVIETVTFRLEEQWLKQLCNRVSLWYKKTNQPNK
jgi:hypothetical protein